MSSFNWTSLSGGSGSGGVTTLNLLSGALTLAAGSGIAITDNGTNTITIASTSAGDLTLTAFGSTPSANAASLSGQALTLQPADATHPGGVSITTQSFAGDKTFTGAITASNLSGTNTGDLTLTAVGSAPSANGASLSGQALTLQPADGTHPGLVTTGSQTFAGQKTFSTGLTGTLTGAASLNVLTSALGNLTDAGTDGIVVTGGTGAVVGSVSLAQHVADTTHNGYLSSTDWNTFNGKQASGNYITALTGDVTASGPGSVAATLAATSNATLTTLSALTTASSLASVGTITSGTWSATAVGPTKGGTGLTGYTLGDLLYSSATDTLTKLAGNTTSTLQVLSQTGTGTVSAAPVWLSAVSTSTASTLVARDGSGNFSAGTITAALTGTASGNTTYSANNHGVVLSSATNAMSVLAPDASTTKVLTSGGSSANPTWAVPNVQSPSNLKICTATVTQSAGTYTLGTNSGIASLTKNGTGDVTLTFSAAFGATPFSATMSFNNDGASICKIASLTTTTVEVKMFDPDTPFAAHDSGFYITIIGTP